MREGYKPILQIIAKNPEVTQKQIADKIARAKCHRKLKALLDAGFIRRKRKRVDESFKYTITNKGLKYLGGN